MRAIFFFCAAMPALLVQPAAAGHGDQLIQGLLNAGAQAVQAAENNAGQSAPANTAEPAAPAASATPAATAAQDAQGVVGALLSSVQEQSRGYLKDLQNEGKKYAQELGKTVVREIKRDPEVEQTLSSVRLLCWGVLIYITLISILIFAMLWRMNRLLEKH